MKKKRKISRVRPSVCMLGLALPVISMFVLLRPDVSGAPEVLPAAPKSQWIRQAAEETDTRQTAPPADNTAWNLLLVNGEHLLPDGFAVDLKPFGNGHAVDSRIYDALQAMLNAARAEGLSPIVCSSYRTYEKQQALYTRKVESYLAQGYDSARAVEEAGRWVAFPGTSEHHTGLAVDIVALSYQLLDEGQERTAEQQWLMAHCHEYGFILRYPAEKADRTGVSYEPWHYRYVGKEAAAEIMARGICLEEYLE